MPILFTGNGKVWKDQELAAAIHYLTPSPPLSPHTSLTPTTCFRVLTIFLSPYPTRTPQGKTERTARLWRACGLICSKNLLPISAWFQFEVLALVLWSPMTRSHPGIKMVLPMSSSAPVSTVLALLSGYWIWMDRLVYLGESSVQFWVWSITIWRKLQLFFYSRVLPDLCVVEYSELNQHNVFWRFLSIFVPFCMKIIPPWIIFYSCICRLIYQALAMAGWSSTSDETAHCSVCSSWPRWSWLSTTSYHLPPSWVMAYSGQRHGGVGSSSRPGNGFKGPANSVEFLGRGILEMQLSDAKADADDERVGLYYCLIACCWT